jgi:replicative DNA helicase
MRLPVVADDFSSPPNRMIFNRVSGLSNRGLPAVTDALRRNKELEKVGGAHRITEISLLAHDEENLKYALDQLLEHSRARQVAKIGERLHKGEIGLVEALKQLEKLNQSRQQEKSWTDALNAAVRRANYTILNWFRAKNFSEIGFARAISDLFLHFGTLARLGLPWRSHKRFQQAGNLATGMRSHP